MAESKGIELYWLSEASACIDAFTYFHEERPLIFLNTHKDSGERARFDVAHEIGHIVLHGPLKGEKLFSPEAEREADRFASAFLMPEETFGSESPKVASPTSYLALKSRWGVSVQSMVRRSFDLDLISRWMYEAAYKEMATRGWRSNQGEPERLPREQSRLHDLVLERLAGQDTSPPTYAKQLGLPYDLLAELMPLARRKGHLKLFDFGSEDA